MVNTFILSLKYHILSKLIFCGLVLLVSKTLNLSAGSKRGVSSGTWSIDCNKPECRHFKGYQTLSSKPCFVDAPNDCKVTLLCASMPRFTPDWHLLFLNMHSFSLRLRKADQRIFCLRRIFISLTCTWILYYRAHSEGSSPPPKNSNYWEGRKFNYIPML